MLKTKGNHFLHFHNIRENVLESQHLLELSCYGKNINFCSRIKYFKMERGIVKWEELDTPADRPRVVVTVTVVAAVAGVGCERARTQTMRWLGKYTFLPLQFSQRLSGYLPG